MSPDELRAAIERFLRFGERERRLSPRTVGAYERELEAGLAQLEQDEAELDAARIAAIVTRLRPDGGRPAPRTQNTRLSAWKSFCGYLATREGYVPDPAANVPWAHVPANRAQKDVLRASDVERLVEEALRTATGPRDAAIIAVLFHAGLRLSELTSLDLGQVAEGPRGTRLARLVRKGGSMHDVPLNHRASLLLRKWMTERTQIQRAAKEEALFVTGAGRRIGKRSIQLMLARLGQRALGRHVHPHLLRHSFATALLGAGAPVPVVQRLMSHADVGTTMIYAHFGADAARDAVDLLG